MSLIMHCELRTRLDLLKPDIAANVHSKQADQKQYSDRKRHSRDFSVGQKVVVRNFREGDKWTIGKIVDKLGPVSYFVQCDDGSMWRRHIDHIQDMTVSPKLNTATQNPSECTVSDQDNPDSASDAFMFDSATEVSPPEGQSDTAPSDSTIEHNATETSAVETVPVPPISCYPQRITRPPERYM